MDGRITQLENVQERLVRLVIDVAAELSRTELAITSECCIYRVPPHIRKVNDEAYTPKVISIGPFHSGKDRLQLMERLKLRYLKSFLERAHHKSLEYWVAYIKDLNPSIRSYYANIIELSDDKLVKVTLVDACFILELFLRNNSSGWTAEDGTMLKPWLSTTMKVDLMLLENQLPFFVLQQIFNEAFPNRQDNNGGVLPSLLQLSFEYFAYYNNQRLEASTDVSIQHFTDMLRKFHLRQGLPAREDRNEETETYLHTATELEEAGLKLSVYQSNKCYLDLQYSRGVLKIPNFTVDGHTEILFRNLLALEQCHYPQEAYVTDYVRILEFLIDTGKDVDLLIGNGIMTNLLGNNNAVADLFNSLWTNIIQVNFNSEYLSLYKHLKVFHNKSWRARIQRCYYRLYSTLSQTAATSTAMVLLLILLSITVAVLFFPPEHKGN